MSVVSDIVTNLLQLDAATEGLSAIEPGHTGEVTLPARAKVPVSLAVGGAKFSGKVVGVIIKRNVTDRVG